MSKVAVILSGCGVYDGAEIHEATICLLALDQRGVEYHCLAPNVELKEIDHLKGEETGATRNVLVESARIARGKVSDIADAKVADYDAVLVPGGFGAAKNLCSFAYDGPDCTVQPDVETFLRSTQEAGVPIGFTCIAPALCAKLFGESLGVKVTIGSDEGTAAAINSLKAEHVNCAVDDIVIDESHQIITTPAYMYDASISEVHKGIDALVEKLVSLIKN